MPSPMQDVHQRARVALRLLLRREAATQLLAITGGIVVARILGPGPLGVFGIALFVVTVLGLLVDLGMRTALIRQSAPLTDHQLATFFTLQLGLVTALVGILFFAAPTVAALYGRAAPELAWAIRLLSLDLYVRSWRSLSEVRLERELRYRELAVSDVAGSTGYHVIAVALVVAGWGAQSLVWATIAANVIRTGLLHRASPRPVRIGFEPAAARQLVRLGVPLQATRIVSLAPGWVTPTVVGWLLGAEAVGLVTWAGTVGRKPLEVLENAVRVSLPHFARLQDNIAEVERALARYSAASMLVCGLWFSVLAVAGRDLVTLFYTERWLPAMPALLVYAAAGLPGSVRWLASAALIGIGRIRFNARVNLVVAAGSITASALLVLRLGFIGVPLGQLAGVAVATPWLLSGLGPGVPPRILRQARTVFAPVIAAIAAGLVVTFVMTTPPVRGLVAAALMSLAYAIVAWRTGPAWLRSALREEVSLPSRLRGAATRS